MASTLFIQLPSKADINSQPEWYSLACPFALISSEGLIQQHGSRAWNELGEYVHMANQVALMIPASEVSVMQVAVPPMSSAKLKAALPNLLEDQIIGDLNDMVFFAGAVIDGRCTVAVSDKAWLTNLHRAALALGAGRVLAYPAQMLVQGHADATTVLVEQAYDAAMLTILPQTQAGFGMELSAASSDILIQDVLQAIQLFAPESQLTVYVPDALLVQYQDEISQTPLAGRVTLLALTWDVRTSGLSATSLDLICALDASSNNSLDWRMWRWPLGLAAAALLVNLIALNSEWLIKKSQSKQLNETMVRTFRTSFPQEPVSSDVLEQMQKKVGIAKRLAGQTTNDDFIVLAAEFSNAWDSVMAGNPVKAATIDYRDRSLFVKPQNASAVPMAALRSALESKKLSLTEANDGLWQIKPLTGYEKK